MEHTWSALPCLIIDVAHPLPERRRLLLLPSCEARTITHNDLWNIVRLPLTSAPPR